jgi:Dolichyl-phosphate-mannose-protein mannosyltransferase
MPASQFPSLQRDDERRARSSFAHRFPLSLWLILALSLLLNLWGIWFGLPDSWHPDELVHRSVTMARNATLVPHSYLYGSAHYYLQLLVMVPAYLVTELFSSDVETQKIVAYLAARSLSAVMGAGCVAFTYMLARKIFDERTALLSALLLTLSTGLVSLAHFATVDVPMLFWMMASYAFSARVMAGGGLRDFLLAGAFAGMAAATKYVGGSVLVALPLAWLLGQRERQLRPLLAGVGAAAAAFLVMNPPLLLASCEFFEGFIIDNAFNTTTTLGLKDHPLLLVLRAVLNAAGTVVGVILLVALVYALATISSAKGAARVLFVTAVPLCYFAVIANINYASVRHVMPLMPPLLILVARMLVELMRAARESRIRQWGAYGLCASTILLSGGYTLSAEMQFVFDSRYEVADWLVDRVPPGATVEITAYGPPLPEDRYRVETRSTLRNLDADLADMKETGIYRLLHPIYLSYKDVAESAGLCEPRDRHYLGWYENAQADARAALASFDPSVAGLERRSPDVLIVSSLYHDRFAADPTGPDGKFFQNLFAGRSDYRLVAELRHDGLPLFDALVEFINPTLRIYRKEPGGAGRDDVAVERIHQPAP